MLHIQSVSKQYGSKVLLENADAQISHRSRIALIGPNGAGKSTLIRMILGLESPDAGRVTRASHLAIGHLAQEVPKVAGRTVLAEVMRLDGRLEELATVKRELEEKFSQAENAGPEASDLERYGRILEELEDLDEYRLEARAKEILFGLGFKEKDLDRSLSEFSGGWLMRVALSRVLLMEPDLILLDEPTNHLDLESLLWLEDFLRAYRGAMLLVSHDRAFLNRMVDEVFEIDQRKLFVYRGNIDAYVQQKQERLAVLRSQYEGQQAKIAEIEAFVNRFGAKATKARQAQSRLKQLEKMERIELEEERSTVRFRFPPAPHSGKEVVTMQGASLSYGDKVVFRDLDWVIRRGSRVAIVGVNGAGKTSLLRLLSGALDATGGILKHGHEVKVGYYAQLQAESLNLKKTILQELESIAPEMPVSQVRAVAGAFLFSGEAVHKYCGVLSGGEKARVALAKLLLSPSNFLLLDEPTNHLDMESREVLLESLQDYEGTLCLVSHDREFMSPLVDSVLEIRPGPGGSEVLHLVGSYDDYLESKIREIAEQGRQSRLRRGSTASSSSQAQVQPSVSKGPSNNQLRAWEKERDRLEREISDDEARLASLNATLGDEATYADKAKAKGLMEEQRAVSGGLDQKMTRWEELCTLLSE